MMYVSPRRRISSALVPSSPMLRVSATALYLYLYGESHCVYAYIFVQESKDTNRKEGARVVCIVEYNKKGHPGNHLAAFDVSHDEKRKSIGERERKQTLRERQREGERGRETERGRQREGDRGREVSL